MRGCIFNHMEWPSSLGKSYVQQSQGQMPPQTEEMLTIVFVMSGYVCGKMNTIKFIILFLFVDHGSRYYSLNIGEISLYILFYCIYKYAHICSTLYLRNVFTNTFKPDLRRMKG